MTPKRRINSGWLDTSCERNTILSLYFFKSSCNDSSRFLDKENAVADANETTPASIKSKIPSCKTSENTFTSLNSESFIPFKTAFATDPTPDCKGANEFVNRPAATSSRRKSNNLLANCCVSSFGSNKGDGVSSCSDKIMPRTLSG